MRDDDAACNIISDYSIINVVSGVENSLDIQTSSTCSSRLHNEDLVTPVATSCNTASLHTQGTTEIELSQTSNNTPSILKYVATGFDSEVFTDPSTPDVSGSDVNDVLPILPSVLISGLDPCAPLFHPPTTEKGDAPSNFKNGRALAKCLN